MADSNIVKWFWQAVETFDEERRARLLQFVTGSTRVPLQGFKALQGDWCGGRVNLWWEKEIKVIWCLVAACKISGYCWITQALTNLRSQEQFYVCQQLCWWRTLQLLLIVREGSKSVTVQRFGWCQCQLICLLHLWADVKIVAWKHTHGPWADQTSFSHENFILVIVWQQTIQL